MKHKIITLLLSTVLFLSVFTLSIGTQNVAAASEEGIVTASSLNLRQSSSTKSKSLTLLSKGTKVQVKSIKNSWMQVYVPTKKKTGWVAKKYISVTKSATAKTASTTSTKYVKSSSLKVMSSSSRQAKVLTTLKKGASVTYLSQKTSWGKVKTTSGITGWVANRDLTTTKPAGSSNTQPVAETASTTTKYVNSSSLNVMSSSSRQAKVLTTLKKGASVTYLSQKTSWGKVKTTSGITGWVANRDLTTTKPAGSSNTEPVAEKASNNEVQYVTVDSLNVMASSSRSAKLLSILKKGATVTYLSQKSSWGKIKTPSGITGWVANSGLSTTKPAGSSDSDAVVETVSYDKIQYVTSDTLNIREEGNASSDKVGAAKQGEIVYVLQTASNGWGEIETEDGLVGWVNLAFLSDSAPDSAPTGGLAGKVIVLDPGHGGKDPGAAGDTTKEKDLTLSTAKKLKTKLEAAGATVYMTRTGDTYPTLDARVQYSKNKKADIFISIHINAGSSSANGIETYYWTSSKNEKELATQVQKELVESTGLNSRGVKTSNFRVIGTTTTTQSILVELGFITNPKEEKIIATSEFQNDAATGIVNGLEAYFKSL